MERRWEEEYRRKLAECGYSAQALLYPSEERREKPYRILIRRESLAGVSLLDVGCGFGGLLGFLKKAGREPEEYTGVERIKEFAFKVKADYPEAKVFNCDIRDLKVDLKFDVVVAFGVMATVRDFRELGEVLWRFVKDGGGRLIFDFLNKVIYKGKLNAYDPAKVLEWGAERSGWVWVELDKDGQFGVIGVRKD